MKTIGDTNSNEPRSSMLLGVLTKRCPRCRRGAMFRSLFVMNENCPDCTLDFDRGDPGYFTGAMYFSYLMAVPLIALLTLIVYLIVPGWSWLRLVGVATLACSPLIPWIWQYSRVLWVYFDQYFDPEEDTRDRAGSEQQDRST
jgi:uncharacterized protein (DUF983 family)